MFKALLTALALFVGTQAAAAEPAYEGTTVSTATGRATKRLNGVFYIGRSSPTWYAPQSTPTITLDGTSGSVRASSATFLYGGDFGSATVRAGLTVVGTTTLQGLVSNLTVSSVTSLGAIESAVTGGGVALQIGNNAMMSAKTTGLVAGRWFFVGGSNLLVFGDYDNIYSGAAFYTGGVERFFIDNAGSTRFNSNVTMTSGTFTASQAIAASGRVMVTGGSHNSGSAGPGVEIYYGGGSGHVNAIHDGTAAYPIGIGDDGGAVNLGQSGGTFDVNVLGLHKFEDPATNGFVGIRNLSPAAQLHMSSGTFLVDGTDAQIIVARRALQSMLGTQTITANACGGVKTIYSEADITTNTTNTFTAPTEALNGCCMDVWNTGGFTITLDNNANFFSAGAADVLLGPGDTIRVCGMGDRWVQIGATGNN